MGAIAFPAKASRPWGAPTTARGLQERTRARPSSPRTPVAPRCAPAPAPTAARPTPWAPAPPPKAPPPPLQAPTPAKGAATLPFKPVIEPRRAATSPQLGASLPLQAASSPLEAATMAKKAAALPPSSDSKSVRNGKRSAFLAAAAAKSATLAASHPQPCRFFRQRCGWKGRYCPFLVQDSRTECRRHAPARRHHVLARPARPVTFPRFAGRAGEGAARA
jgi:hypothetical protein